MLKFCFYRVICYAAHHPNITKIEKRNLDIGPISVNSIPEMRHILRLIQTHADRYKAFLDSCKNGQEDFHITQPSPDIAEDVIPTCQFMDNYLEKLEYNNAKVCSVKVNSLSIEIEVNSETLALELTDFLEGNEEAGELFVALMTYQKCFGTYGSSIVGVSCTDTTKKQFLLDKYVHYTVYKVPHKSNPNYHRAICKNISDALNYFKNTVFDTINQTEMRVMIMCVSNSHNLKLSGICRGGSQKALDLQQRLLESLNESFSQRHEYLVVTSNPITIGLDRNNEAVYYCLFCYDGNLHRFAKSLVEKYWKRSDVGVHTTWDGLVDHCDMHLN